MISTWLPGQDATIDLVWTTMEFVIEIPPDKVAASIQFKIDNQGIDQGSLYVDECALETESEISDTERAITYVTKLDETDELPASVQHHLLTGAYLHDDKGTVKVDAEDTISNYLGVKIVAGSNVTITEVAGPSGQALSIASSGSAGGITKNEITASQSAAANNLYTTNNISRITLTLPTTAAYGDEIMVTGKGAGGWQLQCNAGQIIHYGALQTIDGAMSGLTTMQMT